MSVKMCQKKSVSTLDGKTVLCLKTKQNKTKISGKRGRRKVKVDIDGEKNK